MKEYPRFLTTDFVPFDPLELARETERIVCLGDKRKYTDFYATGVYGGIATGYTCGCCLRCIFCWVNLSREFPEKYGEFYSSKEAFERLKRTAHRYGVKKLRISGAEPTLGKEHLLGLLKEVENSEFKLFILETNGILFGKDQAYVKEISQFTKVHMRVSLKAGTSEGFSKKTGAKPESFELPFLAIENLLESGASFHVAVMTDSRIMDQREREELMERLKRIDPRIARNLEKERVDPYDTTLLRLRYAELGLKW